MSDAEWRDLVSTPDWTGEWPGDHAQRLWQEADRARASESALLAEREGMTGTPTHEGRYWCEIARPDGHKWGPIAPHFRNGRWQTSYTVTRYWRIPGETYTETRPICPACNGTTDNADEDADCPTCKGTGRVQP